MRNVWSWRWGRATALGAVLVALGWSTSAAAASITGVCPDGSIYIVQRASSIPCRDSKQVAPDEVPPLRPEMLPRPYGWELHNRRNDPNNPYNLVDTGRAVRGQAPSSERAPRAGAGASRGSAPEAAQPREYAHTNPPMPPVSSGPPPVRQPEPLDVGLAPKELRDLARIVAISQRHAPATLARGGTAEAPALRVQLAQSRSFEKRLRDAAARAGTDVRGPVVLFSAESAAAETFHANLTFVQGHVAFHPNPDRSDEIGILAGRLGPLDPEDRVLGYVVLPEHVDLAQPVDIYWNDRQLTATLRP